jgi:hypothetical protein
LQIFRGQVQDTQEYVGGCLLGLNVKEGVESLCDLCDMTLKLSHSGLSLREIWGVSSHGLLQNRGWRESREGPKLQNNS